MVKNRKKTKNNKIILVGILIVVIIFIIIYCFANKSSFNKYKVFSNKAFVYSIYDDEQYNINVPAINIKGDKVALINDTIVDKANDFLQYSGNTINYSYEINGKIISLAVQYFNDDEKKYTFDVYNINYKTRELLDNDSMLGIYEISQDDVNPIIEGKFIDYYNTLLDEKIYNNECDFEKCFLGLREIDGDFGKDVSYYIKSGNLYAVKTFNIYSVYDEEKYFTTKDFFIQITQ